MNQAHNAICPYCHHPTLPHTVGNTGRERSYALQLASREALADDDAELLDEATATIEAYETVMGEDACQTVTEAHSVAKNSRPDPPG